ncbi:NUDIX hydrolase [Alkaliphilus peptidifermentans]|uniref:NUDIX domain-containing protein n=1 Tax=Alkaliphilus peptidifermentans DSM 18978 TaxID=1120976 RepID=A0A1G5BJJ8_9FIRM|nr:CoA pyrophosphatase [Alkaliphilus peptidifermentans]SCX90264.1 NUDIX domain-containing protein [Alkaliphilus peptidifermentans DSM 18978]
MLTIKSISDVLSEKSNGFIDITMQYAVLIPIIEIDDKLHILFQIRAHHLKKQPGEICFPGGKIELGETPTETAIRETVEELGISEKRINILGELNTLITPFNTIIYPFCGVIKGVDCEEIKYNKEEVYSIFTVPLDELIKQQPLKYHMEMSLITPSDFPYHLIENGENYSFNKGIYPVYFYSYKNFIIWGITARILNSFIEDIIKPSNTENNINNL